MNKPPFKIGDHIILDENRSDVIGSPYVIGVDRNFKYFSKNKTQVRVVYETKDLNKIPYNSDLVYYYSNYFELDEFQIFHDQLEDLVK